jgi:general secretion pathway protein C
MLERIPRPAWILGVLAMLALGLALGVNAIFARLLAVDAAKLAAASGTLVPASEGPSGEPLAEAPGKGKEAPPAGADVAAGVQKGRLPKVRTPRGVPGAEPGEDGDDDASVGAAEPGAGAPAAEPGEPAPPSGAPAPLRRGEPAGPKSLAYYQDPIVRRNLFDSANALAGTRPAASGADGGDARPSDLEITLIAASVAEPAIWSTALLIVSGAPAEVFQVGEEVLGARIHSIERPWFEEDQTVVPPKLVHHPARLWLLRDGQYEYVDQGGTASARGGSATKSADEGEPAPKATTGAHQYGVKELSPGKFEIPKADLDFALGNLDKLQREARVVPNFQDGASNGFKVFSIRRNSVLRQMGVKNNDVLTGVNGFDLSNTEKALELYSKLQNESHFRLDILRNGEPMTLEYDIR